MGMVVNLNMFRGGREGLDRMPWVGVGSTSAKGLIEGCRLPEHRTWDKPTSISSKVKAPVYLRVRERLECVRKGQ